MILRPEDLLPWDPGAFVSRITSGNSATKTRKYY